MTAQSSTRESQRISQTLTAGWRWWKRSLFACFPPSLMHRVQRGSVVRLLRQGDGWRAQRRLRGQTSDLGHFHDDQIAARKGVGDLLEAARAARSVELELARRDVLIKPLTLPAATEDNLTQVLAFEMDRRTPFQASQVYFSHTVTKRDASRRLIEVRMQVIPRAQLDRLIEPLRELGLRPDAAVVEGEPAGANLLPRIGPDAGTRRTARLNALLALTALALLVAVAAVPLWELRAQAISAQEEIAVARNQAEVTRRVREQLNDFSEAAAFLGELHAGAPSMLDVMRELTRVLPDNTWLQSLQLNGRELQIRGESGDAASLIALIESSELFSGARFRSSLTRNPRTNQERFHLSMTVRSRDSS